MIDMTFADALEMIDKEGPAMFGSSYSRTGVRSQKMYHDFWDSAYGVFFKQRYPLDQSFTWFVSPKDAIANVTGTPFSYIGTAEQVVHACFGSGVREFEMMPNKEMMFSLLVEMWDVMYPNMHFSAYFMEVMKMRTGVRYATDGTVIRTLIELKTQSQKAYDAYILTQLSSGSRPKTPVMRKNYDEIDTWQIMGVNSHRLKVITAPLGAVIRRAVMLPGFCAPGGRYGTITASPEWHNVMFARDDSQAFSLDEKMLIVSRMFSLNKNAEFGKFFHDICQMATDSPDYDASDKDIYNALGVEC